MTTEEKIQKQNKDAEEREALLSKTFPWATEQQVHEIATFMSGALSTPPETGKEWKKDFDSRFDYSIIESVIRDMGDKATWLDMKKGIKAFIRSIESSALAQGEKIGAEKMVEKIKKSEFATMANQMIPEVMKVFYEEIDALKG